MLREITVLCEQRYAEDFGDQMMFAGVLSVTTEDADADSLDEQPLYGEPGLEPTTLAWRRSKLCMLVDGDDFDAVAEVARVAEELGMETPAIISDSAVPDADWVKITQAQFSPTKVSDRMWIVPTWHQPPDPSAINIRMDPGVAFGTGSHPTTHLCLQWLDRFCHGGATVLDYGCGTGILAIAAAKVGAKSVKGTDIDEQAVEASAVNAADNGVVAKFVLPKDLESETFDIVVANILANPLKMLSPALCGRVNATGSLVLSGVLEHQAEEVIAAFRQADPTIELSVWGRENGWVCIAGCRKH